MTRTVLTATVLIALCLAAGPASAVSPQTWRVSGVEDWNEAERESVGVTSEGEVALGLATVAAENLSAFTVWDLLLDGKDVLAATGDGGVLYRISPDGRASEAATVVQPEITALGRDGQGRVLLGTAPDGVIYRLEGDEAVVVADSPEIYIWAIVPAPKGGAIVATGSAGKLYRLGDRGSLELFADPKTEHVTGLVPDGDGFVATTEAPGRLLHVSPDGTLAVWHDADEAELRSPVVAPDGTIYFLANPSDPKTPGRLYRRTPEGAVERLWSALDGFVYDLTPDAGGALWITTGSDAGRGSVVRVEPGPPSVWMEMAQVDEPQILCALLGDPDRRWLGTGGQGHVYRVPGGDAGRGTAVSPVHDAGDRARWGALSLEPGWTDEGLAMETRSGNTKEPGATWSDWKPVALSGGRGQVASAPARFLQWRLTITDAEARLGGVEVRYLPANLAPRVNRVEVAEPGADLSRSWDATQPGSLVQELPGGIRVEFQVPNGRNATRIADDAEAAWARRYRAVTWTADDPNDDELRFTVAARSPAESAWFTLAEDLEASPWIWDSATVPDGWYLLRVTASDAKANPPGGGLAAERVTRPVLVDNTAPRVTDLAYSGGVLTAVARDEIGPIRRLEIAVDGGAWKLVFPEDGIPDMPTEKLRVELDDLDPGEHVVLVRATDDAGNLGTGQLGFTVR